MSKFLLIPVMPTPNGPLHLGHIAGPYLKMDVLARLLRRNDHDVALVSATDPYETHVLPEAARLSIAPDAVCAHFHDRIALGLKSMTIQYDRFINPMVQEQHAHLVELTDSTMAALHASGLVEIHEERVPFSTRFGIPVIGSTIGGTCPECGVKDAGGFYCEDCGAENSPRDLLDVRSEVEGDVWEWRTFRSAFLRISEPGQLVDQLQRMDVDANLLRIAKRHLQRNENLIRLSHPGHWGVRCLIPGVSPGSVVFSYAALYSLSQLCANFGITLLKESAKAFSKSSTVTTVKSFGFDNTVPYFLSLMGQAMAIPGARPFSIFLTNYFCTLDGAKFSTSRNHAIWAHEAAQTLETDADMLRLYLAKVMLPGKGLDFSRQDFRSFCTRMREPMNRIHEVATNDGIPGRHNEHNASYARLLAEQGECFASGDFNLPRLADTVLTWLFSLDQSLWDRQHARALAALAWPLMPTRAAAIWQRSGLPGLPDARTVLWEAPQRH